MTATIGGGTTGTISWTSTGSGTFTSDGFSFSAGPPPTCTLSSGTCSVFYSPSSTGSQTITATSAGAGGTTGTYTLTVYGAANKLAFTNQPTNTTAGSAIDSGTGGVKVSIEDSTGNVVTNSTDSVTIAIGTATVGTMP